MSIEKLDLQNPDLANENFEKLVAVQQLLKQLSPETEMKVI